MAESKRPAGVKSRFRAMALALEGAEERAHMGHPDFRAAGRVFASIKPGGLGGALKLTPEQQHEAITASPQVFVAENGAWGQQGWTRVDFAAFDVEAVGEALTLAWRNVTRPAPRKRR